MAAGFKISNAFVSVTPDDDGFEPKLRAQVAAATDGVKAVIGLEVRPDAVGPAETTLGEAIAAKLTDSISDTVRDELPPKLETPFRDTGTSSADIFTKAFGQETVKGFGDQGVFGGSLGASLGTGLGDEGKKSGGEFTAKFSESAKDAMMRSTIAEMLAPDSPVGESIVDQGDETGKKAGKKMGESASEGMSPLLIGAFTAAATLGPAAILAGMSVAVVGLGALVVKSNADIQATYQHLASDVGDTLKTATAPLVPAVEASLVEVDSAVKTVAPTLKALFTDAEPDMYVFTQGVTGLAEQFLPRFTQAVNDSRGIVADFSQGLPELGAGLGNFFTGLTVDSQATGRGLQDFESLTGTALGTAGHVIGSFSAAASTALSAVVPAADGVLTVIDKLASPATIGALAGGLAVKQWGSGIQSGLQSVSNGFLNVAAKAEGASGLVGAAGNVAEKASGGFSTMADVMGGPWGIAIGAGVGLLGGFVASMDQSVASASDFTAAIAQDSGQIGSNTESIIQQTLAKSNLNDMSKTLGLTQAQLIEYASGDAKVQQQVAAAYDATTKSLQQSEQAQRVSAGRSGANALNPSAESISKLAQQKAALDAVTTAVAAAVKQDNDQSAALLAAEHATNVFTQQVDAAKIALGTSAQAALVNATALNQTLPVQGRLSAAAINAALAYQQTTTATSAYTSALQALDGTTMSVDQAQNTLAQQMLTAKTSFASNKDSLDKNTQAGIDDRTALVSAAQAITALGTAQYQQTGNINTANKTIQQQIDKFVAATGATGKAKAAIEQYLGSIAKIPANTSTTVHVDTSQASLSLNQLLSQMDQVRSTGVSVASQETHRASGGPAAAGHAYIVGEQRQEMFVAPTDGYIYPSVGQGQQAVAQHNSHVAASSGAPSRGTSGMAPTIIFQGTQYPNVEQMAALHREFATAGAF